MSNLDEARYGRACLLILNICPFVLRRVISDYYIRHGSLSIQDFLEKKKHDLFHLLRKRCCCRPQQSSITPMNNSQWDSLYIKNISSCRRGQRGDCPCKYDAKPMITTDVLDITLCCLFIKNVCPGITINMVYVDTIREVRNNLIHAGSASLDEPTFRHYWNRVEHAIIYIALHTSPKLHSDTKKMVKDLEDQLINTAELAEELKRLLVDEERIEDLEENVSEITDDLARMTVNLNQTTQKVTHIEGQMHQTTQKVTQFEKRMNQTTQNAKHIEDRVNQTTRKVKQNEGRMNQITQKVTHIEGRMNQTTQKVTYIEGRMNQTAQKTTHIEGRMNQTAQKTTHIEGHMNRTTQKMTQMEESVYQNIQETRRDISLLKSAVVDQSQEIRGIQQDQLGPIQEELFEHGRQIDYHDRKIDDLDRRLDEQSRQIQTQETQFKQEIADIKLHTPTCKSSFKLDKEPNIGKLKQRLIEINDDTAKVIPISPLQERGDDEMPIELLFASVIIREDPKYIEKGRNLSQQTKYVRDPADLFIKDGILAENIYMLGDAAHGKTTFCIWLLRKWCDAQQTDGKGSKELDKWRKVLKRFDFVFLLQFRYVNPSRDSIIDMICQDVFRKKDDSHDTIRHVLSSDNYRSLIIMDGLDEWNPNEETSKRLTCKGIPNIDGVASSVSCFISMRPWVFPTILKMVKVSDRVIEIHGLSETGMEKVIESVLLHHYNLKDDPSKYTATYNKIVSHLENKSLKSFMKIPLLAVVCVQIWYTEKQVGDSMTSFYAVMLNMLIERADQKHEFQIEHSKTVDCELPEILSENEYIEEFNSVLLKLGKVAYKGLLSNETSLVFQKKKLEKEIGVRELQFALDVGLISQKEAPSTITKNVSVHFFHKSIQEFLAVIYIVTQKAVSDSFCKHLSNVKVIMELSNVIMFICGTCPSLGSVISQRVVSVTEYDTIICKHRESPRLHNIAVMQLYKLQVSWYRELQYGQRDSPVTQTDSLDTQTDSPVTHSDSPVTETNILVTQTHIPVTQTHSPVTFHISDVYLDHRYSDTETVRVTRELLSGHHDDIRSLYVQWIPIDGERGITDSELDDFLSNKHSTRSLVMLYIDGVDTGRSVPALCVPALRCLYLHHVTIISHLGDSVSPSLLTDMSQLRELRLVDVTLGEGGLGLSPDMVQIKKVKLVYVSMLAAGWGDFVWSVSNIKHRFNVVLRNTNIDDISVIKIRSSPDFTVIRDSVGKYSWGELLFTRVWPQLTHDDE